MKQTDLHQSSKEVNDRVSPPTWMTSKWCVMQEWGCLVDHSSSPFRRVIGERPRRKAFSACSFRNTGLSRSRSLHGPSTQINYLPKPGCIITPKRITTTNFYNLYRYLTSWHSLINVQQMTVHAQQLPKQIRQHRPNRS